jgi:hypothetical protein
MDVNDLKLFGEEIAKTANPIKKLFGKGFKERARASGKTLKATAGVTGLLGVGGITYGAITQPAALKQNSNRKFKY